MRASLGAGGPVDSKFAACADVPKAGVLLALPPLLASGLWEGTEEHFELPKGYYQMALVFLLVAFLALARVRSLEGLRYYSPFGTRRARPAHRRTTGRRSRAGQIHRGH